MTVTAAALSRLLVKLHHREPADDVALRFTRMNKGWKLRPDHAQPDDKTFAHEGRIVLLLDRAVAKAMAALTLDTIKTKQGVRLKLRRSAPQN